MYFIIFIYFIGIVAIADVLSNAVKGGVQSCVIFFSKVLTQKKIR